MFASELARRTIVQSCKYRPIARLVQHNEAKTTISNFLMAESREESILREKSDSLRERMADSDFERDLFDHNADYLDRFASISDQLDIPQSETYSHGKVVPLSLSGVRVTSEIHCRFRRLTKSNKVKTGGATLRYAKGKPLNPEVGAWQSAFLLGYLRFVGTEDASEPEGKLCITIDAYAGEVFPAPTDSISRFKNMMAACESIAERWPKIKPPKNARL